MGHFISHIFIACADEDKDDMVRLLAGMAVHSDFITWYLNDLYTEEVAVALEHRREGLISPRLNMWHGFTYPGFAWDALASLLTSVFWKSEKDIQIQIEVSMALEAYSIRQFFHAVREGKIK